MTIEQTLEKARSVITHSLDVFIYRQDDTQHSPYTMKDRKQACRMMQQVRDEMLNFELTGVCFDEWDTDKPEIRRGMQEASDVLFHLLPALERWTDGR